MTSSDIEACRAVLIDVVELRLMLSGALAAVKLLPWDSDVELVSLSRANVSALLHRYLRRELSPADLEAWANAVEGRDDIGAERGHEDTLQAFVFETANPLLTEPISDDYARRWLDRVQ